ncbi:MAG TPA: hypothetical protein VF183_07090, partial [Acidimicrobiales bacterium]
FFADMEAAWRNIGGAVRGGGRLALMGWSPERSEWREAMIDAVAMGRDMPEPQPGAPGPFGLADRDRTKAWLRAGGFDDIRIETRALPFFAGRDTNDALEYMSQVPFVAGTLASLDGAARAEAIERLRATMEAHETSDGVLFDSEALFVTATKR